MAAAGATQFVAGLGWPLVGVTVLQLVPSRYWSVTLAIVRCAAVRWPATGSRSTTLETCCALAQLTWTQSGKRCWVASFQ